MNMDENTRVVRETKQIQNMNIPPVDDNLCVCVPRGRNLPYVT